MAEITRFDTKFSAEQIEEADLGRIPVLVPAHNSEKRIKDVISNLGSQHLPNKAWLEVYVCANACEDGTAMVASEALDLLKRKRPNYRTHLIVDNKPGQAQALNTMIEAAGRPEWAIEYQDDSFATRYAIAILGIAASLNSDLGVIGVVNEPLPTYRGKNGTSADRLMYGLYRIDNPSKNGIIDRLCVFRPEVVGEFPDMVSVDNYMVHRSIENSGKFGLIDNSLAKVFFRLPTSVIDILNQQNMYVRGTQQTLRLIPNFYEEMNDSRENPVKGIEKIKVIIEDDSLTFKEKLQIIGLKMYAKSISRLVDMISPYTSSKRTRIRSSV